MKKLLLLLFFTISLISCNTESNQKNLNEELSINSSELKKVDTIKKVDNEMINFLAIGRFVLPIFLKVIAKETDIKYVDSDYDYDYDRYSYNPLLNKILKNYLDYNALHPIEGIYNLIHNGGVRFKVFIYKSSYDDRFIVKIIEHSKYIELQNHSEFPEILQLEYFPFGGTEEYRIFDASVLDNKSLFNHYFQNNRMLNWTKYLDSLNNIHKNSLFGINGTSVRAPFEWDRNYYSHSDYTDSGIYYHIQIMKQYAFIEETSIKNTYTIIWTSGRDDWNDNTKRLSPSIGSFIENSLITFSLNTNNPYGDEKHLTAFGVSEKATYKASFMKIYPKNSENSKSVNKVIIEKEKISSTETDKSLQQLRWESDRQAERLKKITNELEEDFKYLEKGYSLLENSKITDNTNPINKSSWTINEKKAFLKECIKNASINSNYTESQIQNYCDCTLKEMMLKYNKPTSNLDMQWVKATRDKCLLEAI